MVRVSQSPTDPGFVQNPYPFYAKARSLGDFVFWEDYGMPIAVTHRAVTAILKDRRLGRAPVTPPAIPKHLRAFSAIEAHSMLELEPPRHTRLRGLVLRGFTSRRIAALGPEIEALSGELIDRFPGGQFDLLSAFARKLPVIVIARLLGVPESLCDQLLDWSNAMVAMYQARRSSDVESSAEQASRDFAAFLRGYIAERRSRPADDLITELIAAEEDGQRLSEDEMISTCILLLNAGHEATVHTMGNAVRVILETGSRNVTTRDAIEGTVEEVLRFDPPLHMFTRHVYEDIELFGHRFERGDEIGALLASANRDPAVWTEPDEFRPARPARKHTAFGAGIHFCVGAPLARLELQIGLSALFARHPQIQIAEPPRYADLYHFHGLEQLMVRT